MGYPPPEAFDEFIRQFKALLFGTLAREIPEQAFRPGQEAELRRCVERIVDARLIADKVPIGRQGRKKIIDSILADIGQGGREWLSAQ
jgi:hypothetical protein